jgi:hypothetical protein
MTRSPWLAGAVLLLLLALLLAPLVAHFGLRYWSFYAGVAALLLLLAGWLERLWQSRPLASPGRRRPGSGRLRVVKGGRGNGRAGESGPEGTEGPRWLM